ncbi:hypothetical protein [Bifidobacterium avesanii]|uniref:Uncharacterized protein n=1 Tax=Bifidobacterium avesanii TaxID=1798157 RepID=A0A7K3TIF0_9BIFI|nr:hypothetical protein [Bifidobacterium avesanii]KAB8294529.1 hypothetical protein DSM100685_0322 [Bifidobacterium avesanii]NEG78043.1 hypothetical protein [Bifidobacterium avesanii]
MNTSIRVWNSNPNYRYSNPLEFDNQADPGRPLHVKVSDDGTVTIMIGDRYPAVATLNWRQGEDLARFLTGVNEEVER